MNCILVMLVLVGRLALCLALTKEAKSDLVTFPGSEEIDPNFRSFSGYITGMYLSIVVSFILLDA